MYKVASDKRQAALHHGSGLKDWIGDGQEHLTLAEQYQNLIRVHDNLYERMCAEKDPIKRKELGVKKLQAQNDLSEIKAKLKLENTRQWLTNRTFEECFVQVAREMLLPAQFKAMMNAAERLKKQMAADATKVTEVPNGAE